MVIPFSTMFYMEHLNISLWNSVANRNLTIFSFNSWIFTLFLNDDEYVENPEEFLRSNISKMEALSLNSRVYFFVITNIVRDLSRFILLLLVAVLFSLRSPGRYCFQHCHHQLLFQPGFGLNL